MGVGVLEFFCHVSHYYAHSVLPRNMLTDQIDARASLRGQKENRPRR